MLFKHTLSFDLNICCWVALLEKDTFKLMYVLPDSEVFGTGEVSSEPIEVPPQISQSAERILELNFAFGYRDWLARQPQAASSTESSSAEQTLRTSSAEASLATAQTTSESPLPTP